METTLGKDQACVFCQIVAGETEASLVYQDDLVTATMDLYPVTPGHVLVLPNRHATLLPEIEPATIGRMFTIGAKIDRALRRVGIRCEAVSLYLADGAAAGQVVAHTHLHVVPRFPGDACGLRLHTGPAGTPPRSLLQEHADLIRGFIETDI
ncbi:MAG: HIT family protein [Anaerolineales bacterium]|nr:MAG: HIT family protein [Anaerolineales bacterium]